MKFCSECGKKLKDSAEFCFSCGAPCDTGDDLVYMERRADYRKRSTSDARKSKSKSLVAGIWAVIASALILGVMFAAWYLPARRSYTDVMNGQTEEALMLFNEKVDGNSFQQFVMRMLVPRGASAIVKAYDAKELTYTDATERLNMLAYFEKPLNNAAKEAEQLEALHTSTEAYKLAQDYEASGDVLNALLAYRMVSESDSNYDEAIQKTAELEGQYKSQVIAEAGSPVTEADYLRAEALIKNALEIIPGDVTLQDQLTTIRQSFAGNVKASAIQKATDYISKGYYKQAIEIADQALSYNEQDLELRTLRENAIRSYEDFVRNQVSVYLGNKDKQGALVLLNRVQQDLPDSAVVQQLMTTVNAA